MISSAIGSKPHAFLALRPQAPQAGTLVLSSSESKSGYFIPGSHPTATRIKKFAILGEGWHFGQGYGPSAETIAWALKLHAAATGYGLTHTDAFPGIEGEIQITVYLGEGQCIEMTVESNGLVHYIHERGDAIVEVREFLHIDEAIQQLRELVSQSWISSACSTSSITTQSGVDFRVLPSRTARRAAFPYSTLIAR